MTKDQELQRLYRWYKDEAGKAEVDLDDVVRFAKKKGYKLPAPQSPEDLLKKMIARAIRQEVRQDTFTGKPYRVNHHYVQSSTQLHLWIDIDEAPRTPMFKSFQARREQMVGDGLQLSLDVDHWNSIHPEEEPIQIVMDFTEDIEERKNAPDEEQMAS